MAFLPFACIEGLPVSATPNGASNQHASLMFTFRLFTLTGQIIENTIEIQANNNDSDAVLRGRMIQAVIDNAAAQEPESITITTNRVFFSDYQRPDAI